MTNKEIWLYLKSKSGGGESTNLLTVFNASVTNGKIAITALVDKMIVGDIKIPSKIEGASVTSIGYNAFNDCTNLESITIPNSVTSIGNNAFQNCSSLTSVNIPNNVTSIGNGAFYNCSSLTSVNIPNNVTSIGNYTFESCSSLTSVNIPNSVTSIGAGAFKNCSSLTSANIPNNVTSIGGWTFQNCSSLTFVNIPNSVTSIENGAFTGCGNLSDVILENNFNCNNLDLSASNKYSKETIVSMLNALADRTGETAYTLTLSRTNLAKLTDEEIAIATAKNWTLA